MNFTFYFKKEWYYFYGLNNDIKINNQIKNKYYKILINIQQIWNSTIIQ